MASCSMTTAAGEALGELRRFLPHTTFTKVQERVIPALLSSNDNVVVAAPTGSGKTLLLEVAMLKLFRDRMGGGVSAQSVATDGRDGAKAVYVCPIKALASEKYDLWCRMFSPLSVVIETGDQDRARQLQQQQPSAAAGDEGDDEGLASVATADIIITTPERWDSITRRWKERTVLSLVSSVSLFLVDEVHTVHEGRGAALEAVVSRMKAIKAQQGSEAGAGSAQAEDAAPLRGNTRGGSQVRFVAISGTLPNIEDFAEWLQVKPSMTFSFSSKDRPVPLTIRVLGFPSDSSSNPFAFSRFLSFRLFSLIRQYSQGKPTIVFCATRKEASSSAQRLVADIRAQVAARASSSSGERIVAPTTTTTTEAGGDKSLEPSQAVLHLANTANDRQLRQCLLLGIAYHHAAMTMNDRLLVERMFREQYIAAICTTTTLALGVNLPAHLVVVKGTTFFKGGKCDDVPLSEVAQMCGRAGRPGLDSHGVALVLTTDDKVRLYENLVHGDVYTTVESQLHRNMIEHVNAEVALRTIHSFASGLDWIRTTFFWIRLRRCPQHYGLKFATKADERAFQPATFAERLMQRVLTALYEEECIDIRRPEARQSDPLNTAADTAREGSGEDRWLLAEETTVVESTRVGRNMARMYILFDTVKTFHDDLRQRCCRISGSGSGNQGDDEVLAEGRHDPDVGAKGNEVVEEEAEERTKADSEVGAVSEAVPFRLFRQGASPLRLQRRFHFADVLALCCRSAELDEVGLRQGDKGPLNEMNKLVRFPIRSGHKGGREVRENWHKSYVLLQSQLSHVAVAEVSLRNDLARLWTVVPRVTRFLSEYARFTHSYSFFLFANLLLRCVEQRVWPDGLVLKQLSGVSDSAAKSLSRAGYRDFAAIRAADPRKLEAVCGRLPPFGTQLQGQLATLPRCVLSVHRLAAATTQDSPHRFRVTITPREESRDEVEGCRRRSDVDGGCEASRRTPYKPNPVRHSVHRFLLLAGARQQDQVLLLRYVPVEAVFNSASDESRSVFEFTVPAERGMPTNPAEATVEVALLSEHWVGNDVTLTFSPLLHGGAEQGDAADAVASSDKNEEQGHLSHSSSTLADSHSIVSLLAKQANGDEKASTATATHCARRQKLESKAVGERPAKAVEPESKAAAKADSKVPTPPIAAASAGQHNDCYAAVVREARSSFEGLLQDLQYIDGTSRMPSQLVRCSPAVEVPDSNQVASTQPQMLRSTLPDAAQPTAVTTVLRSPSRKRDRESPGSGGEVQAATPATVVRRVNFNEERAASPLFSAAQRQSGTLAGAATSLPVTDGPLTPSQSSEVRIRCPASPEPYHSFNQQQGQQQPPQPHADSSEPYPSYPSLLTAQQPRAFLVPQCYSDSGRLCGTYPSNNGQCYLPIDTISPLPLPHRYPPMPPPSEYRYYPSQQSTGQGHAMMPRPETGAALAPPMQGPVGRFRFNVQVNDSSRPAPPPLCGYPGEPHQDRHHHHQQYPALESNHMLYYSGGQGGGNAGPSLPAFRQPNNGNDNHNGDGVSSFYYRPQQYASFSTRGEAAPARGALDIDTRHDLSLYPQRQWRHACSWQAPPPGHPYPRTAHDNYALPSPNTRGPPRQDPRHAFSRQPPSYPAYPPAQPPCAASIEKSWW